MMLWLMVYWFRLVDWFTILRCMMDNWFVVIVICYIRVFAFVEYFA
jgi:hypothetical protein